MPKEKISQENEEPPGSAVGIHSAEQTGFPVSPHSELYRRAFFPGASSDDWNDWRWQCAHRVTSPTDLCRFLSLSEDESEALYSRGTNLTMNISPYYLSLLR